jgi:nucleotide-binding universal stress UspA family protein
VVKLKRILLPTDFSQPAAEAAEYAYAFAEQFSSELHLLHVIRHLPAEVPEFGMGLNFAGFPSIEDLEKEAISKLAKVLKPECQKGRTVVLATKQGPPFVEIVRYAQSHEIDLIVMGTHGRSALPHALLGSVAEKVVRKAPCPVLTVRPKSHKFVMP